MKNPPSMATDQLHLSGESKCDDLNNANQIITNKKEGHYYEPRFKSKPSSEEIKEWIISQSKLKSKEIQE